MAFLKIQKLVTEQGKVVSGSAALVDTEYVAGAKHHAKHRVLERLGKILYLREDRREGIFQSPTRGIVLFNADTQQFSDVAPDDPRIAHRVSAPRALVHTVFGDAYLLLRFLKKEGLLSTLRQVFPEDQDYQRLMGHVLHDVLRNGSRILCNDFLTQSFASALMPDVSLDSFRSDAAYYTMMGTDEARRAFFRAFVQGMRRKIPGFGKGCGVDSMPIPDGGRDSPFTAWCGHGVEATAAPQRLMLVLDEATGLPVWHEWLPGNALNFSAIMNVLNNAGAMLDVEIEQLVLDAGYINKELLQAFHAASSKKIIIRLPVKKEFFYRRLYEECQSLMSRSSHDFVLNERAYFGCEKEISLFNMNEFACVYVDREKALAGFRHCLEENEDEFQSLTDKDKDWLQVKHGFFILLSNQKTSPKALLKEYFEQTSIETALKTKREFSEWLPRSQRTNDAVRGKILHNIIVDIVVRLWRRSCDSAGVSLTEIIGGCQSLMCCNDGEQLIIETPSQNTKNFYRLFDEILPARLRLEEAQKLFNFKNVK